MTSFDHFTTERLIADRLREPHLDDLLRMDRDPRVMKTLGGLRTEDESREYLRRNLDHWEEYGVGQLAFDSVVAGSLPDNIASRNVLEKIGGRYEMETVYKGLPHVVYRIGRANRGALPRSATGA